MVKRMVLVLLLGMAVRAEGASTPERLRGFLAAKDWSQGSALCAALPEQEANRRDRPPLPPSYYAEAAALCAGIESGAGDDAAADWWWFTATAMDGKAALALLPQLRSAGLLAHLSPPRKAVTGPELRPEGRPPVTLPSGEEVAGERVSVVEQPRPPHWFFKAAGVPGHREVAVELLIGADGIARQPLLISAKAGSLQAFLTFAYLRLWRFSPARVAGQPTASIYQLKVHTDTQ